MAMKRCPICGERYSDTYKDCPFCEEEEAYQDGEEIRRRVSRGGRRVAGRRRINWLTPVLIVLIALMASLLAYLLWGDAWTSDKDKEQGGSKLPTSSESIQPETTEKPELPDGTEQPNVPEEPTDPPEEPDEPVVAPEPETEYDKLSDLPNGLTLSTTDFTLRELGETHTIRVSGGSSSYTWVSEDSGIASVDSNGKVTAISGGTVNVLVTDGSKKAVCVVRVKASGSLPPATTEVVSGGSHELNREDMTLKVGEAFQLKLSGVTTSPTWSSSKTGVATVSGNGTVVGVAPGTSTVTVSWDGGSLSCIVRVK